MYAMTEIELARQHREEAARQVENNRLGRQLRAVRSRIASETGNTLLGRVLAWSPQEKQTAGY
jgi:hypothetical protein